MTASLFDPPALRIVPRGLRFPATWDERARAMAERRQMTQAQVDSIERRRWAFRERQRRMADMRRDADAAFEAHWTANEKTLSHVPVPPVPHIHAAITETQTETERVYLYFDAHARPLPGSHGLALGTRFKTVSSPSGLHTLNPVYHGWWRSEWLVVMAPDIRGQMCRQYEHAGGPYALSEIEVARWRSLAQDGSAGERAA